MDPSTGRSPPARGNPRSMIARCRSSRRRRRRPRAAASDAGGGSRGRASRARAGIDISWIVVTPWATARLAAWSWSSSIVCSARFVANQRLVAWAAEPVSRPVGAPEGSRATPSASRTPASCIARVFASSRCPSTRVRAHGRSIARIQFADVRQPAVEPPRLVPALQVQGPFLRLRRGRGPRRVAPRPTSRRGAGEPGDARRYRSGGRACRRSPARSCCRAGPRPGRRRVAPPPRRARRDARRRAPTPPSAERSACVRGRLGTGSASRGELIRASSHPRAGAIVRRSAIRG